jgi:cytochrome c oxidase subunit 4
MAEHSSEHHTVPIKYYIGVFLLLMVLTIITVLVAKINLEQYWGPLNIIVALTIAVIKATAVVLIFMHVRWSSRLTQVVVVSALFWLTIMLVFTISDYWTRGGWPTNLGQ